MMNSLKKIIAVVIAFTMISGALLVMVPSVGESAEADALAIPEQMAMYADPEFRKMDINDLARPSTVPVIAEASLEAPLVDNIPLNTTKPYVTSATFWDETGPPFTDVDNAIWYNAYNIINMTKMGEGEHCELWVADNRSFYDPMDPRNSLVDILPWQVNYMIDEFDKVIYPNMTETFILPPALDGSDPDVEAWQYMLDNDTLTQGDLTDYLFPTNDTGKIMVMVFNVIDENWYDGSTYGSYVAGYYSPSMRTLYDRNIMHIDCYDWIDRIGDNVSRPYVYESTFAHEYQHLLHDEIDPDEDTWVNEGLSMASEFLCGYGIDMTYVTYYLYWPENSLTVWGDLPGDLILGDYGAVLMFMAYLYDHYGGKPMLQSIFFSELNGIESIEAAMMDMGYNRMTFDRLFHDWRLANLILDTSVGAGIYGYKSFDKSDLWDPWGYQGPWYVDVDLSYYGIGFPICHSEFGTTQYIQSYGVDYYLFYNAENYIREYSKMFFDGDDQIHEGWEFIDDYWWSGNGDQIDNLLTMEVDLSVPVEDGEYLHWLDICTEWQIEEYWDYGFVQVSTDDGATWTTLDDVGDYCTYDSDPSAMESIVENLPGLTGSSGDLVELSFDLSAYDGMNITVGFRYMTDWAYNEDGWLISGVMVDGADVPLEELNTIVPREADFMVTLVAHEAMMDQIIIIDVPTMDVEETAQKLFSSEGYDWVYVLVSPKLGPVDYCVGFDWRPVFD